MTSNLGSMDRLLRLVIGLALIAMPLLNIPAIWSSEIWSYVTIAVGLVLVGTALIKFCPLYRLFGISTCST